MQPSIRSDGTNGLRLVPQEAIPPPQACCRCQAEGHSWDWIAANPYCPDCQERLIQGTAPPLIESVDKQRCAICQHLGTIRYMTFPLQSPRPVTMDLCAEHFRNLLGRCLGPHAYYQLCRLLRELRFDADQIFLLHHAFYDGVGRALQPVREVG